MAERDLHSPVSWELVLPKFHFNIHDGVHIIDTDGTELASWQEAKLEAIRYAGALIQDEGERLKIGQDWRMEVCDSAGLILFRLDFSIAESAAIGLLRNENLVSAIADQTAGLPSRHNG